MQAQGAAEVAVQDAPPVVEVLGGEGDVEAVGVAEAGDVGCGSAVAEHLDDGVAGDEVDHEEDDRHDDPQHRQGGEDAAQDGARG